jgi:G:T-mismatch repair DNA endonuclease (very short patch repair protein)
MYESNIYNIIKHCYSDYVWDKNKFPKKNVSIGELEWMEYLLIQYPNLQYRNDQYRLPYNKRCSVDGFDSRTNTIFQYHGCYWHGCLNCFPNRLKINRKEKTFQECYERTTKLKNECLEYGYNYIEMWECKWIQIINAINHIKNIWKSKKLSSV